MNTDDDFYAQVIAGNLATASEARTHDERLKALRNARRNLEILTTAAVSDARQDNRTWEAIGEALDVTKQAAQQRYGARQSAGDHPSR